MATNPRQFSWNDSSWNQTPSLDQRFVVSNFSGKKVGLSHVLSYDKDLERIRASKSGFSLFIASAAACGIAIRHFRMYRFTVKNPSATREHCSQVVNRGMEQFGTFCSNATKPLPLCFWSEFILLLTCAFWTLAGNSIHYEFGYRWLNQTQYSKSFQDEFLSFLDVEPVRVSVAEFTNDCCRVSPSSPSYILPTIRSYKYPEVFNSLMSLMAKVIEWSSSSSHDPHDKGFVKVCERSVAYTIALASAHGVDVSNYRHLGDTFAGPKIKASFLALGFDPDWISTSDVFTVALQHSETVMKRTFVSPNGRKTPTGRGYRNNENHPAAPVLSEVSTVGPAYVPPPQGRLVMGPSSWFPPEPGSGPPAEVHKPPSVVYSTTGSIEFKEGVPVSLNLSIVR